MRRGAWYYLGLKLIGGLFDVRIRVKGLVNAERYMVQAGHDGVESSDFDYLLDIMRDGMLRGTCTLVLDIPFRNMYLHVSFLGDDDLPYRLKGLNSGYDILVLSLV